MYHVYRLKKNGRWLIDLDTATASSEAANAARDSLESKQATLSLPAQEAQGGHVEPIAMTKQFRNPSVPNFVGIGDGASRCTEAASSKSNSNAQDIYSMHVRYGHLDAECLKRLLDNQGIEYDKSTLYKITQCETCKKCKLNQLADHPRHEHHEELSAEEEKYDSETTRPSQASYHVASFDTVSTDEVEETQWTY